MNQVANYDCRPRRRKSMSRDLMPRRGHNGVFAGLDNQLLQRYLPGIASYQWSADPWMAAQEAARDSDDVIENEGPSELTVDYLASVYRHVLDTISQYEPQGYGAEEKVSRRLLSCLQHTFDNEALQLSNLNGDKYANSRLNFLALSAISRESQSRDIGMVLSSFFRANYESVVEECQHSVAQLAVAEWAYGIYCADMPSRDKRVCLREIIRHAPQVVHWMHRSRSRVWVALGDKLQRMEDEADRSGLRSRSRRRRSLSDEEEDDLQVTSRRYSGFGGRDRRARSFGGRHARPRSAPGENRRIAHQASRLANKAEDLQAEAEELRELVLSR
ncbi:hypothetical protein LTR08_000047 [Meristemomyces frigidus]|nr:hypothetical protein LTR08_000047 [Meristemomyces frigidus]